MLFPSTLVLAASLLSLPAQARDVRRSWNNTASPKQTVSKATSFKSASPLTVSDNVLTLTKTSALGSKRKSGSRNAARAKNLIATGNSSILTSLFEGEEFVTNITVGSTETFQVIVDTGSSDTWVAETGFQCVDIETSDPLPEDECEFGTTYNLTSTFSEIPGENFNITYGDGEFLTGIFGTDDITLAGITVNQTMAVVNFAAWDGDGVSSGLVGFAYPSLTSAYNGTDPALDNSAAGEQIIYDPIFTTMYKDGLVAPLFSLAIERDLEGPSGYLALGGVPPVDFVQNFTETPILVTTIEFYPDALDFYTIEIDGMTLDGVALSNSSDNIQYIVDSGTTLNYLPTPLADAVNAAFVPPAVYSDDDGAYLVECDATAPSFGIVINGTTFFHNALDMILPAGTDNEGTEICISGIDDGGDETDDVFILGDTFQKNVVAVFDVGAGVLKFAARENYTSDDTY